MSEIPGQGDLEATRKAPPSPAGADPALEKTVIAPSGPRGTQDSSLAVTGLPGRRPGVPPTRTFGRYELVDEIARGGMGVVFRARQVDAQRDVALKVLLAGDFASDDDEKRFIREAELAAQLNHPNIVAVHDIGSEAGRRYFTMEIVDGRPLDKWAKGLPLEKHLRVMIKVCRAAHHAHMRGVIHRDLKPGNILVTEQAEPKILDFGLAKTALATDSSVKTVTGQTLGTPFYMAPEQAAGRVHEIDIRTDVWALGVILQEIVSGERPFQGKELLEVLPRIEMEEPIPLKGPVELRLIVGKALEKDRARRYPTAEAMAEDLERFLAGDPVSVRPPGVVRRFRRWARKNPAATGALVAIAAAAFAAVGWEFSRPGTIVIEGATGGAVVEIDGRPSQGESRVPAGRHLVTARAPGFEEFSAEVSVERGERRTIPVRLARSTGFLDLEADEPGTTVEIAGEIHGLPLRHHAVPTGNTRLTFRRRGCDSRERWVDVGRNTVSTAWVCLPSARYSPVRAGNVFRGPVTTRDANADGIPDVAGHFSQYLMTLDGSSGQLARFTLPNREAVFSSWCEIDWDGDGVGDDAVLGQYGDELRVSVWSGREMGEPDPARGRLLQKKLWEVRFPANATARDWPRPLARGRVLWIPVGGGFRHVRAGEDAPGPVVEVPSATIPLLSGLGADSVLASGGTCVVCFDLDGRERWRACRDAGIILPSDPYGAIDLPAGRPIPCVSGEGIFALDPGDGRVVWSEEGVKPRQIHAGETASGRPETVYSFLPGGVAAWDVTTGRRLFAQPAAVANTSGAFTAWATKSWCAIEGNVIVCRSAETGQPLWRFDTGAGASADPAVSFGASGAEYAFVTRDHRLIVLGEDGALRREALVDFTPQEIHAAALDADGRPDWVLVGYGLQVVRSSRVLWRRASDNAVRSRPVTYRRSGKVAVAQVLRSGDDRVEMHALAGATGEILWRYGTQFDVMLPPALYDWNGDGTLDLFSQTGSVNPRLVCINGADGTELTSTPLSGSPYPTAVLRDLDGDSRPEAILFEYPVRLAARRFGEEKPVWSLENDQPVFLAPLLVDLDGDGMAEIVAAFASADAAAGSVGAWTLEGRPVWRAAPGDRTWAGPFLHDLDGDGKPEIAVPCPGGIVILGRDGSILARFAGLGGSQVPGVPLPDGGFVIGTRTGVVRVRRDGTPAWSWAGAPVTGSLGVTDLPGAPAVVGADSNGRVFRLDLDTGRERWHADLGARCEFGVTLDDLDGDGIPEALLGCDDFSLYAIDLR